MKNYLVSIIVPVYNSEAYIDCTISSIINQTYKNIEIIVVNDGSTDGTIDRLSFWKTIDNRIMVYNIRNQGVSNARNFAISKSKGKLLLFVDSDDVINKRTVEYMLNCYVNEKSLVICGFERFKYDMECDLDKEYLSKIKPIVSGIELLKNKCHGYYSWGILYEKKIIDNEKITFDVNLGNLEDVVWNAIYLSFVKRIVYVDLPLYKYRINPNSITSKSVNSVYQAECHYKAYISIKNEICKRKFDLIQKRTANRIKFVCLKGLCGELCHANIAVTEFLNQLSDSKMPSNYEIMMLKIFCFVLRLKNLINLFL